MSKKNFESALAHLEQITQELESSDLGLDAGLKKFEEGMQLLHFCNARLDEARAKVGLLMQRDGVLTEVDFPHQEQDGDQGLS